MKEEEGPGIAAEGLYSGKGCHGLPELVLGGGL